MVSDEGAAFVAPYLTLTYEDAPQRGWLANRIHPMRLILIGIVASLHMVAAVPHCPFVVYLP